MLSAEVRMHLEGCPECRDFLHSLGTFVPTLRSQFESALLDYTGPEVAAVLENRTASPAAAASEGRGGSIPAAFQRLRGWLFGPVGKPAPVVRLAAVSVLAAALVCLGGVRFYMVSRTHRMIERQIDRIVAGIYEEPLLPGIESALLRVQPSFSDYMEDWSGSVDAWGEDTDTESYLD